MLDRLQTYQTHQVFLTQPGVVFVTCYQHHTEEQPRSDAGSNWEPELSLFRAFMGEEKKTLNCFYQGMA